MGNEIVKIIILDSAGMAGHIISKYLKQFNQYKIIDVVFDENMQEHGNLLDIGNTDSILEFLDFHKPHFIINALRMLVNESSEEPHKAVYINSYFPRLLEAHYKTSNTQIIHLSTDCVFSGEDGNYKEDSRKDGIGMYSTSRALGEIDNDKDLTIRTSFIGPVITKKQEELFDWFLMQEGEVKGYNNAFWTGVSTLELAINIERAITLGLSGIYHMVPVNKISKYELLKVLKNVWGKDEIVLKSYSNSFVDKSLIDTRQILEVSDYDKMFIELKEYMQLNSDLYSKYF